MTTISLHFSFLSFSSSLSLLYMFSGADLDKGHEASDFSCFFCERAEKIVHVRMFGTDLGFSYDITVLASDVDGKLGLVLVDSKIQHWRSLWVKVVVVKPTIAYARPLCVLEDEDLLNIMS